MEVRLSGLLTLLLLMLAGCGGDSPGKSNPHTPVSPASMFMERSYHFCSEEKPDRFLLGHYGTEGMGNEIHFFIVTAENDTIFREQWPAKALLAEHGGEQLHPAMESFINQRPSAEFAGPTTGPAFSYSIGGETHRIGFCRKSKSVIQL